MSARYKAGDHVVIAPEYREGDDFTYRVVEDNGDRLTISPIEWPYMIAPLEVVSYYMVQPCES